MSGSFSSSCRFPSCIRLLAVILAGMFLLPFSGCTKRREPKAELSLFAMDTYVRLQAEGEDADNAVKAAASLLSELEQKLSRTLEGSEVSALNRSSKDSPVTLSEDTYRLLSSVCEYAEKTEGRFDPTIAPLMDLWGFGTEKASVPDEKKIGETLARVDFRRIHLLSENQAYVEEGTQVDLGGAAKGFIGQLLMEKMQSFSLSKIILDLGGNICVWSKSSSLSVGVISPLQSDKLICICDSPENENLFVITSGAYERYFEENGVKYGHIMDTRTGCPVVTDLLSATIIGSDGTSGDILSTTLFALGCEEAKAFAVKEKIDCILCAENGTLWVSSSLEGKVHEQEGWTIRYF
ncbi:MAG: FAD:protein FMN transferase [Clostridiales bacterium]|nr:FAD:protein FMN transferase [Clostridiales bacterium]